LQGFTISLLGRFDYDWFIELNEWNELVRLLTMLI